jgi:hypothetical protein
MATPSFYPKYGDKGLESLAAGTQLELQQAVGVEFLRPVTIASAQVLPLTAGVIYFMPPLGVLGDYSNFDGNQEACELHGGVYDTEGETCSAGTGFWGNGAALTVELDEEVTDGWIYKLVNPHATQDYYVALEGLSYPEHLFVVPASGTIEIQLVSGTWKQALNSTDGASLTLGTEADEAYPGNLGAIAGAHVGATNNPHNTTAAQVGAIATSAIVTDTALPGNNSQVPSVQAVRTVAQALASGVAASMPKSGGDFTGPVTGTYLDLSGVLTQSKTESTPASATYDVPLDAKQFVDINLTSGSGLLTATLLEPSGASFGVIVVYQHAVTARDLLITSAATIEWTTDIPNWLAIPLGESRIVSYYYDGVKFLLSSPVACLPLTGGTVSGGLQLQSPLSLYDTAALAYRELQSYDDDLYYNGAIVAMASEVTSKAEATQVLSVGVPQGWSDLVDAASNPGSYIDGDDTFQETGGFTITARDQSEQLPAATFNVSVMDGAYLEQSIYRIGATNTGYVLTQPSAFRTSLQLGTTQFSNSYNSVISSPALIFTGSWYTGGTGTSTRPHFLLEPSGTTATSWSTSGTAIGVNGAAAFAGNLIDLKSNNTSRFTVPAAGANITIAAASGYSIAINSNASIGPTGAWSANSHSTIANSAQYRWSNLSYAGAGMAPDLGLERVAAGLMGVNNITAGQFRDIALRDLYWWNGNYSAVDYVRGRLTTTSSSVNITAETGGTGADNLDIVLAPAGTGKISIAGGVRTIQGDDELRIYSGGTTKHLYLYSGSALGQVIIGNDTYGPAIAYYAGTIRVASGSAFAFGSSGISIVDVGLRRAAAGLLEVYNGATAGVYRDLGVRDLYWWNGSYSATDYVRGRLTTTSTSVNITAETGGTGSDNINVVLTPTGTGIVQTTGLNLTANSGSFPACSFTRYGNQVLFIMGSSGFVFNNSSNSANRLSITDVGIVRIGSAGFYGFSSTTSSEGASDLALYRNAAGVLEVNNGTAGTFRDVRARNFINTLTTPASASATGVAGTITADTDYVYVCTATDTWKRVAIATW